MSDLIETESPDGVLVSLDAGTPSAFPGQELAESATAAAPSQPDSWVEPLEALEFTAVLERVAGFAAGPLGADAVRARRPGTEVPLIQEELTRVEELAGLIRGGHGLVPEPVPELRAALGRLRIPGSVLDGVELLGIRRTVIAGRLVVGELQRIAAEAPHTVALERPLPDKNVERRLEQALDDDGEVRDSASPALASARSDIRTARERLVQRLESLLRSVGGEGGVTLRDGRYVIPVPRDLRTRPDGIIHGESASGATLYLEPAAVIPLGNAMREAESRAHREELKVLRELTERLRPESSVIRELHAMCVAVDDLSARARYAVAVEGFAPRVATAPATLKVVNARHPLLLPDPYLAAESPSRRAAEVVPFDLTLEDGELTVLLSGPNTGGKSVLLKAVGLAVALAQSGIVPPLGPESLLPVFRRIFADIGDRQSIAASLSTFSAHLTLLRVILAEADDTSLVLLDEIGSGTDPAEGAALAGATLQSLTRRGAVTLATTHLGALKRLATESPGIVNASLQFDAATLQPTYRLLKGVPGRSYGIAIARRLGLDEAVLLEAEAQVPAAERSLDALLAAVEEREQEQARREERLAERLTEAEGQAAFLAAQAEAQTIREAALKKRERDAEKQAREQARAYLLEARETVDAAVKRVEAAGDSSAVREARRLVEDAAAAEARKLKGLDATSPGRHVATSPQFVVGQRVRLESGTVGEVFEVRGDGDIVVRVGSLKLVASAATLTGLEALPRRRGDVATSARETPASEFELDLRGLSGDEAEHAVLAAVDAAVLSEQPFLRIIHGKGTGVVRERVQRVLGTDRRVRSHAFAPSNQGGTGVTIAEFGG